MKQPRQFADDVACRAVTIAADAAVSKVTLDLVEGMNCAIGDDQYGVDTMSVREIKEWSNVTHLPKRPDYVRGALNLRGIVLPIIDLCFRFGLVLADCTPMHIIVIVQMEDRQMGLLADRVLDIVSFDQSEVQSAATVARSSRARFLSALVTVEGAMIALIDLGILNQS